MKKLKLILVILICNFSFVIWNSSLFAKGAGSSSGITLLQPVSAKAVGLAEACSAISGEVLTLHYNPSGLATLKGQEISLMYQRGLDEDSFASILYSKQFPFATLGASVLYYNTGKVELYDLSWEKISKVGQRDIIITVGAAREISKFSLGLNFKVISSQIFGERAAAFAMDFGSQYKGLIKNFNIGLSLQNFGTKLEYLSKGESLPLTIRFGTRYKKNFTNHAFLCSIDFPYYINDEEILFLFGVEYTYKKLLSFRGGYRLNLMNLRDSSREDEPINCGIGITWKNYSLDYAIGITKNLDLPHRLSIGAKF